MADPSRRQGAERAAAAGPRVAVAVVSWNTRALLDDCLASLRPDAESGLAEVWVVDNGSTDGSRELVAERHPWATLLTPAQNLGYGPAVNLVAERSAAPWIVAANSDIVVQPGALAALVDAGEADPRTGALSPKLVLPDGSVQQAAQPFPTLGDSLLRALRAYRLSGGLARRLLTPESWEPDRPAVVPMVTGAFMALRREAFDAIGRFDEEMWLYAEDLDVCWRLARAGWRTRYEPRAVVHHVMSASTREAFGEGFVEQWVGATWAWMVRRRGLAVTWATAATRAADARLRVGVLRGLERRDPGRWSARRRRAQGELASARLGLRSRAALLRVR